MRKHGKPRDGEVLKGHKVAREVRGGEEGENGALGGFEKLVVEGNYEHREHRYQQANSTERTVRNAHDAGPGDGSADVGGGCGAGHICEEDVLRLDGGGVAVAGPARSERRRRPFSDLPQRLHVGKKSLSHPLHPRSPLRCHAMSSRADHRRHERDWERDDRDRDRHPRGAGGRGGGRHRDEPRRRSSRSRSPRRGGDRRGLVLLLCSSSSPADFSLDRRDYRRDGDRDKHRDADRRDGGRDRKDDKRRDDRESSSRGDRRDEGRREDTKPTPSQPPQHKDSTPTQPPPPVPGSSKSIGEEQEEGEEMDVAEEDDSDMMAAMGLSGFGSSKVCSQST